MNLEGKNIQDLERALAGKDEELKKMEHMFKEYSTWRAKLDQIELKMKADVDFWKQSCDKL